MSVLLGAQQATNKSIGGAADGSFRVAIANFIASATGTAETISWYHWYSSPNVKAAVYTADGSTKLGETAAVTGSSGLKTGSFLSTFSVSNGTEYMIALINQIANQGTQFRSNNDASDSVGEASLVSASPPATMSPSYFGNNLGVMGVTIDGTLSGGGSGALLRRRRG